MRKYTNSTGHDINLDIWVQGFTYVPVMAEIILQREIKRSYYDLG